MSQVIGIASDHGGKLLKEKIARHLESCSYQVLDFGVAVESTQSVDYPDYACRLALEVGSGRLARGILICGTGIGMSIAANRILGVRAALVWDEYTARLCKQHNDANILCLGERTTNHERALDFISIWLTSDFSGDRHQKRLQKIDLLKQK